MLGAVRADHIHIILCAYHCGEICLVRCLSALIDIRPPVRHQEAGIAPFVPDDLGAEIVISGCPEPVDGAVGRHDGAPFALSDRKLEAFQIDLAERTFGDRSIKEMPVCLLIVAAAVLDRSLDTGSVQSAQLGDCDESSQLRIFGEILKVSAVQRMPVNIHAGAEQAVHLIRSHFQTDALKQAHDERQIEGRGEQRTVRQAECLCAAVQPHSGGAVRAAAGGDAVFLQRIGHAAECGCRSRCDARAAHALAADDLCKLRVGEPRDERFHRHIAAQHIGQYGLFAVLRHFSRQRIEPPLCLVKINARDILPCDRIARAVCGGLHAPECLYRRHCLSALLHNDRFIEKTACGILRRADIRADIIFVFARLAHPAVRMTGHAAVIIGIRQEQFQIDGLRLSRFEDIGLIEDHELTRRLTESALRRLNIELHDLFSGIAAGIFDRDRQIVGLPHALHVARRHGKAAVRETEAERIADAVLCEGLEIAIADIDILGILIAFGIVEKAVGGVIADLISDRIRQLAAGRDRAGQNRSCTGAAGHAALPDIQHRIRSAFIHKMHIHDIAGIEQDDDLFKVLPADAEHLHFVIGQQIRAGLHAVILLLAGGSADHDNSAAAGLCSLSSDGIVKRHFLLRPRLAAPALAEIIGMLCVPFSVDLQQRFIDADAGFEQAVQNAGDL